jgi:hypothetical protein
VPKLPTARLDPEVVLGGVDHVVARLPRSPAAVHCPARGGLVLVTIFAIASAARRLRAEHVHRLHQYDERPRDHDDKANAEARDRVRAEMLDAEREELVKLRDRGVIGDDVMRVIQHDLDLEQMLVGAHDQPLETKNEERGF